MYSQVNVTKLTLNVLNEITWDFFFFFKLYYQRGNSVKNVTRKQMVVNQVNDFWKIMKIILSPR